MEPEPTAFVLLRQAARSSPIAWAGLIVAIGSAYLVARLVVWSSLHVAFRAWRRSASDSWVERARLAWPARRLGRISSMLVAAALTIALVRDGRQVDLLPPFAANLLVAGAAYVGGLQAQISWGRRINPAWALTPRPTRGVWVGSLAWIGALLVLAFTLVFLAPPSWDARAWALLAAGTMAVGLYFAWGWRRFLLWTGVLRPADDRLRAIATRAADRAGIKLRSVDQAALPILNAFAFVHDRSIAATDAMLAVLDDPELSAVCAHELAHVGEPGWVRAIRLAYGLLWGLYLSSLALIRPAVASLSAQGLLLIASFGLAGLLVVGELFRRLSHRMEVRADAQAGPAEESPGAYGRALARIYEMNLIPVVMGMKRSTHPELYDRLVAAGARPDYPRPAAPPRGPWWAGLIVLILGMIAGGFVVSDLVARRIPRAVLGREAAALWTTGAAGGGYEEAFASYVDVDDRGDEAAE